MAAESYPAIKPDPYRGHRPQRRFLALCPLIPTWEFDFTHTAHLFAATGVGVGERCKTLGRSLGCKPSPTGHVPKQLSTRKVVRVNCGPSTRTGPCVDWAPRLWWPNGLLVITRIWRIFEATMCRRHGIAGRYSASTIRRNIISHSADPSRCTQVVVGQREQRPNFDSCPSTQLLPKHAPCQLLQDGPELPLVGLGISNLSWSGPRERKSPSQAANAPRHCSVEPPQQVSTRSNQYALPAGLGFDRSISLH